MLVVMLVALALCVVALVSQLVDMHKEEQATKDRLELLSRDTQSDKSITDSGVWKSRQKAS
jgi:hypothetical protein